MRSPGVVPGVLLVQFLQHDSAHGHLFLQGGALPVNAKTLTAGAALEILLFF
jgi:hypothetical protein